MKNKNKAIEYSSSIMKEVFKETSIEDAEKIRNRMLLAAKIEDAFKSKGLNKRNFAKQMRKHPSVVTKWISGTHNFTADTLWDIERVLNINLININNQIKEYVIVYGIKVQGERTEQKPLDYNSLLINSQASRKSHQFDY